MPLIAVTRGIIWEDDDFKDNESLPDAMTFAVPANYIEWSDIARKYHIRKTIAATLGYWPRAILHLKICDESRNQIL